MSGLVKDNIFRSSGSIVEAAGGLSWQPVVVAPTGATLTVTVQNVGGSNYYYINGVRQDTLSLKEGFTYRFDQADSSNSGHPFRFSTTSNGTHGGGSEYTTGVTTSGTPGNAGAYTQIAVAVGAPTLYYYCTNHNYMGGTANTVSASVSVSAGKGYFVNTTAGAITIELPSSAEAGDQIILVDYARTWGTNSITIDSNGLNFQGEDDSYTVDYDTAGQSLNLVYSGATKGWTPSSDIVNALEPVAPAIQRGIFAFGYAGGVVNTRNLVSSSGVVSADASGAGTARYSMGASTYGGDKAIFAFGNVSGTATNLSNLVNNSGVVGNDVTGVGTARANFDAAGYGGDKAIFAYGNTLGGDNYVSMSNLVSNQGVVATDVTGVGLAREELAACSFGDGNAIFGYGMNNTASDYQNITNKVNSSGVVASNTTGVGTARKDLIAANYSDGTVGMFIFGEAGGYKSIRNLVNSSGVVANDSSVTGTDAGTGSTRYGGDKAIIAFGRTASGGAGLTNGRILISNTGSVAGIVSGAGTARNGLRAAGYSYSA